jgi:hypothetical protein
VPMHYDESLIDKLFPKGYTFSSLPKDLRGNK